MAPKPSEASTACRLRGLNMRSAAASSVGIVMDSVVSKLSNFSRRDFQKGEIRSASFHTANTNPHVNPETDCHWTATAVGPSYNKRRMLVVMYIFGEDMFCLPLFTRSGRGIASRPARLRKEYVAMKDHDDTAFKNDRLYSPVVVCCRRKRMDAATGVILTGGRTIGCNKNIAPVSHLEQSGYTRLELLYQERVRKAQKGPFDGFNGQKGMPGSDNVGR